MRYIFDFDHTLFDTDRFSVAAEPYKADGLWVTPAIWDILDASSFFYADTVPFLENLDPTDVTLLTAWTPVLGSEAYEFQKVKVERSGIQDLLTEVQIVEGDKGSHVRELYDGRATVFVDDRVDHLLSAKKHCPDVQVVQMIRPGVGDLPTDQAVPVISNLNELSNVINS